MFLVVLLWQILVAAASINASEADGPGAGHLAVHGNTTRSFLHLRGINRAHDQPQMFLRSDVDSADVLKDRRPGASHGRIQSYETEEKVKPVLTPNAFVYTGAGIMLFVTFMVLLSICEIGGHTRKAYRSFDDDVETCGEGDDRLWAESIDELVDRMGMSALCLVDLDTVTLSGFTRWTTMPILCVQCWLIQGGLFYYLTCELKSWPEGHQRDLPASILAIAMYLHTVVVLGDMALSISIFGQLRNICTDSAQYAYVAPIYFVDTFLIPAASLIVGTLYLVTSRTTADVILNSCALAFIGNIDNWILGSMQAMNSLAGTTHPFTLVLPINQEFMYYVNNGLVVFPLFPAAFACYMLYVGQDVLHL